MQRPVIGITMDSGDRPGRYQLCCDYAQAIDRAGGLPLLIPYQSSPEALGELLAMLSGVLLTGGDDLDPSLYGEERHPRAIPLDLARQEFELRFMAEVEKRRKPTLCICLGCQVLNVHRGGSLMQFIPDVVREHPLEHRKVGAELPRHTVHIEPGSLLARAVGATEITANTYHKQAIARVGRDLRIVARAPDGIIEAVEDPAYEMMLGVQWHPERLLDEERHLGLFRMLVERARNA